MPCRISEFSLPVALVEVASKFCLVTNCQKQAAPLCNTLQKHNPRPIGTNFYNQVKIMNSSSFYQASNLNNYGASLIKQGRYEEAATHLKEALQFAKLAAKGTRGSAGETCFGRDRDYQRVSRRQQEQQYNQRVVDEHASIETLITRREEECTLSIRPAVGLRFDESNDLREPYVYRDPLLADMKTTIYDSFRELEESEMTNLSFAILFNLSLSTHLCGLSLNNRTMVLKKLSVAQRLYECTFRMQAQQGESDLLITIALLNNLSLVHKALGNQFEMEQCEQLLISTIFLLVDILSGTVRRSEDSNSVLLEGFLANVMHLITGNSQTAAAA